MRKQATWLATVATAGGVFWAGATHAQTTPLPPAVDPAAIGKGLIDRQRDLPAPEPLPAQPAVTGDGRPPAAPEGPASGATFELKGVRFDSSAFLPGAALDALVAPRIGTRVSIADLRTLVAEVNALYAVRGIVTARAYLPPQKIADGTVRIALVEGRLGALNVPEGRYTGAAYVRSRIAIAPGEIVDLRRLRQQINAFNRGNDMRIQAQLQPGSQVGLTDVLISIAEPGRNAVQLFADSYGYASTGRYQGGFTLRHSALLLDGDRVNLYGSVSDGGLTGSASYSVMAGTARLGLTYARSQITVTQGPSAKLDIQGFSDTASLNLAQPLVEQDSWHATLVAAGSYTASKNRLSGRTVGQSWVYKATGGVAVGYEVSARTALNLNLTASVASAEDRLEPAGRTFPMYNGDITLDAGLGRDGRLHVTAAGQHAASDFIPSNQLFQLGGPGSVRGFQPGSASGSSGYFTQAELHLGMPKLSNLDAFVFLDHGKVFSKDFGDRALASVGVGATIPVWRFSLETSLGVPITHRFAGEDRYRADARLVLSF